MIMRRRAVPGQGGNLCDFGRLGMAGLADEARNCDHNRVLPKAKINVIERTRYCDGIS
jgi:hypothetical protein